MPTSINWGTRVIFVPRADMPIIQASPEVRSFDINQFRLDLRDLEDDALGIPHPDTHIHNTEFVISGFTYARSVEIINGYTVEFEDGLYGVAGTGANANILDVKVANSVSYNSQNSGGLLVTGESGLTPVESQLLTDIDTTTTSTNAIVVAIQALVEFVVKLLRNRRQTNPVTGKQTVFDDDSTTTLVEGDLFEDIAGGQPYRGQGADRADRME